MVVIQAQAGFGTQAEDQRRCYAPTVIVDLVAAGDVAFVTHQVQAECGGVEELIVAIEGVALGLVRSPGEASVGGVAHVGAFAHQVDGTARRTTTADSRVRALGDFDRFNREDFAGLRASVTYTVQVHRALRVEATNEGAVA
ncbi:hypothetical protein D9M71_432660 [compost metagenome]